LADLILKPGRDYPVLNRHPWIFSGAVDEVRDDPSSGEIVAVRNQGGEIIAWAGYSPTSQIRARILSWDPDVSINRLFFREKLHAAVARRDRLAREGVDARRLVHAESDGLPGLIVDQYNHTLVVQFLFTGIENFREVILEILSDLPEVERIYERSDADVRSLEGLAKSKGLIFGKPLDGWIAIQENELTFQVDIVNGHKTGFYLDQRRNRQRVRDYSMGARVLDCYAYSGGFGLNALFGGASSVSAVEASQEAILLGRENQAVNDFRQGRINWIQGDVPTVLREMRDRGQTFDLIVLDPPKFAPTSSQAQKAARGYKDINLLALKLLEPGGTLFTFSCSGGISAELFQKIVSSAAMDARIDVQVIDRLSQGEDHPVGLFFPEGAYLKGLVCRKC
jgi:23S rRNA (cytosine1962-C5)-methyltransferase